MIEDLKNILDFISLKETYLFANTPRYLYKNFRNNQSILILSEKFVSSELKKLFYKLIKQPRNIDVRICLYSLVIALSFKQDYNTRLFIKNLNKFKVEWFKELSEIIISSFIMDQNEKIDMKFRMKDYFDDKSKGSTNSHITVNA